MLESWVTESKVFWRNVQHAGVAKEAQQLWQKERMEQWAQELIWNEMAVPAVRKLVGVQCKSEWWRRRGERVKSMAWSSWCMGGNCGDTSDGVGNERASSTKAVCWHKAEEARTSDSHLTRSVAVFVQYWSGREGAIEADVNVMYVLEVLITMERYLCVNHQWSGQYITNDLGADWNWYIVGLDIGKTWVAGKDNNWARAENSAEWDKTVEHLMLYISNLVVRCMYCPYV